MFGWITGQYRFNRYRSDDKAQGPRILLTTQVGQIGRRHRQRRRPNSHLRDLVNTPAEDMGPAALEAECEKAGEGAQGGTDRGARRCALEQGLSDWCTPWGAPLRGTMRRG